MDTDPTSTAPPALFDEPPPSAGPVEVALRESLPGWHATGQVVSVTARALLIAQAQAVDAAARLNRPTAVTGATAGLLELMRGFGLVAAPQAADNPFKAFLEDVETHANHADDR